MEREEVREAKKEGGDGLAEQEERRRRVENWQNRFDGESVRLLTDSSTNSRCPRPIERNPEDYRGGHSEKETRESIREHRARALNCRKTDRD